MTYEIRDIVPEPTILGVTLRVDGVPVARAYPNGQDWRIYLDNHSDGDPLVVDVLTKRHARRVLEWIGEKASPSPAIINGPGELHLAKPAVTYRTDYNGGNQYRLRSNGAWEYRTPTGSDWSPCSSSGRPYKGAYPLVEMR